MKLTIALFALCAIGFADNAPAPTIEQLQREIAEQKAETAKWKAYAEQLELKLDQSGKIIGALVGPPAKRPTEDAPRDKQK